MKSSNPSVAPALGIAVAAVISLSSLSSRASSASAAEGEPALDDTAGSATSATSATSVRDRGAVLVGAKAGAVAPFDGLRPNAVGVLELGYLLPFRNRAFAVALDAGFSVPKATGSARDPRTGGGYSWHLTQQELTFTPALYYRVTSLGRVVPYVGVGPRIYLFQSFVRGSAAGKDFTETREQSTKVGFAVPLGAELSVGPGAFVGELLFEWGPLTHTATGDTHSAGGSLQLGYRLTI